MDLDTERERLTALEGTQVTVHLTRQKPRRELLGRHAHLVLAATPGTRPTEDISFGYSGELAAVGGSILALRLLALGEDGRPDPDHPHLYIIDAAAIDTVEPTPAAVARPA